MFYEFRNHNTYTLTSDNRQNETVVVLKMPLPCILEEHTRSSDEVRNSRGAVRAHRLRRTFIKKKRQKQKNSQNWKFHLDHFRFVIYSFFVGVTELLADVSYRYCVGSSEE